LALKTIFVTIEAKPKIVALPRTSTRIIVNKRRFEDTGLGGWTGFYDWLRPKVSEVIGLRYSPFEEAQKLLGTSESINLFFGEQRVFVEELSGDQDFEEVRLFTSPVGAFGLLVGYTLLNSTEIELLESYISGDRA
jgi:hypothetical protein